MNINYWMQLGRGLSRLHLYIRTFGNYGLVPAAWYRQQFHKVFKSLSDAERKEVEQRAAYYIRIEKSCRIDNGVAIKDFRYPFNEKYKFTKYFFDLYEVVRYFDPTLRFRYEFGDVTHVPSQPTFVKSRPISPDNANSVLLKLNRWRHFRFVHDSLPFSQKANLIVSRNVVRQPHRARLLELYSAHPMCDFGKTNKDYAEEHPEWVKGYLNIGQQLRYKFIVCIEGNDVATALKWVMSSNSIAVMPPPTYETWFMEGTLIPDYHYIAIKPDYSDLIERVEYYLSHSEQAEEIVRNAHAYVRRFVNPKIELATSLAVASAYFYRTGQTNCAIR